MNATARKIAITISPPLRTTYKKFKNPNRFLYLEDTIQIEHILKYNRIKRYIIYPEFDPKGRLHYHGIITLDHNELVRFYKHAMHKLSKIGFIDFKPLETFKDNLRWVIYMKKEFALTRKILEIEEPLYKNDIKKKRSQELRKELEQTLDKGIMEYLIKRP